MKPPMEPKVCPGRPSRCQLFPKPFSSDQWSMQKSQILRANERYSGLSTPFRFRSWYMRTASAAAHPRLHTSTGNFWTARSLW